MISQLSLFDLEHYRSESDSCYVSVSDPYWDEIVLDSGGFISPDGQTTLIYDDSQEPPDPDDYPSRLAYYQAFDAWSTKYPQLSADLLFLGFRFPPQPSHEQLTIHDALLERSLNQDLPVADQVDQSHEHLLTSDFSTFDYVDRQPLKFFDQQCDQSHEQSSGWVERYSVKRSNKKHYYYRYRVVGSKPVHIGSIANSQAIAVVQRVRVMIKSRCSPDEIFKYLQSSKSR